jgi:hypothetical protein
MQINYLKVVACSTWPIVIFLCGIYKSTRVE